MGKIKIGRFKKSNFGKKKCKKIAKKIDLSNLHLNIPPKYQQVGGIFKTGIT